MIGQCDCGSFAINPMLHGRVQGVDEHLCDVCYWRRRAEEIAALRAKVERLEEALAFYGQHRIGCLSNHGIRPKKCSCGLTALKEAKP